MQSEMPVFLQFCLDERVESHTTNRYSGSNTSLGRNLVTCRQHMSNNLRSLIQEGVMNFLILDY